MNPVISDTSVEMVTPTGGSAERKNSIITERTKDPILSKCKLIERDV
jgi:hypothetical protein